MTKFRGCIDIHSGQVKQIVGGTLTQDDTTELNHKSTTTENFVSTKPSSYYAELYKNAGINGCHVIKLGSNPENDEAAKLACQSWPNNLQVGGGINGDNALEWLDVHKASHVILTSWLFSDSDEGKEFDWVKLKRVSELVGKSRLIVDLSCRELRVDDKIEWVVAMNKWQTLTNNKLSAEFLGEVSQYCDEFLIHAADVEGLCNGIDVNLVAKLGEWCPEGFEGKIVYAGGARSVKDLDTVSKLSDDKVDLTYGSALDVFGGKLVKFDDLVSWNELH
ncbi:DEHA2C07568p [Debaryomyces hansenii CBS767]|uniref:1-(5-phosphoribosyl)-5-[(5-phosphoribosylamino)methylideneamino] imidazole-4-carboxamide isomerase n=1 Tax=Debaryomyces hansenii (strain ATCC 36239 / CBS 767 / BCRC 21394 / JCM 1990 / NBRC 0083 / IGC 2968) TaxID=284592 RepID=HIS4_DEBHA|nr:DEHA2C07568p [Debaryomyces hansenii CBS767]Q6BUV9.2 RecName: Full=1-(5-phosphoribosyl)-5-[(5-phosphoribosylamino)methylideneamino] imidazole-4-carboxamide isomerase; AltName: Full=5-proFAR isomerase; AltName: Full=Phosphoribosylformimino-5-aminoimidazole carboxamide ribotide isomerase [Debaryomyces hansenii CBS767]CAG86070.2 DEHA2C07568p [Debaryomyces hansenii CBS767]|eukprot:XP_458010.2 DEHA2C07568p [Debaryomyces hansenii CBS767]